MNWVKVLTFALPITSLLVFSSMAQAYNVRLHGALVAEPCIIAQGDESVRLDFGTVIDKYLYINERTRSQAFDIRLSQCDLSLAKTVKVTFGGVEDPKLKGLLAVNSDSKASGIAIGIETRAGQPLPLNKTGQGYRLVSGSNVLSLQAYVQAEPAAIAKRTIEGGPFSAVATFSLEYE
ncbi:fimbrial protein [Erwinia persicina]|uniref:fimbrial protein n=1 Tax=Erwinia persicina TaxID=55211 RepID=UPI0039AF89F3